MSDESEKKKDLTRILELSALMPPKSQAELLKEDPFAVNEMQAVEQIDDFASIESMGMMDHAPEPEEAPAQDLDLIPSTDDPLPGIANDPLVTNESTFSINLDANKGISTNPEDAFPTNDFPNHDFSTQGSQSEQNSAPPSDTGFSFTNDSAPEGAPSVNPFPDEFHSAKIQTPTQTGIAGIKQYSERSRETTFSSNAKSPFHLWMQGSFDPYSRDKLLLFITENPMGLNSSDLDRQINAGRVLLPRISEFAGIKLIQDLRDSGLSFKLAPSSRDEDEVLPEVENLRLAYVAPTPSNLDQALPVFAAGTIDPKLYQAYDSIEIVQFLKADIVEVERSELFQELLERMTVSLKQKAKLRGAEALSALTHELKPLRLPSQYQIELKATLLKKL